MERKTPTAYHGDTDNSKHTHAQQNNGRQHGGGGDTQLRKMGEWKEKEEEESKKIHKILNQRTFS